MFFLFFIGFYYKFSFFSKLPLWSKIVFIIFYIESDKNILPNKEELVNKISIYDNVLKLPKSINISLNQKPERITKIVSEKIIVPSESDEISYKQIKENETKKREINILNHSCFIYLTPNNI